jgi:drug/metabolite transporter (DMT)-like permease
MILVSILFAGVIVLSNVGLDKIALNIHVLLRTTTIFWIIAFSFFLPQDSPPFLSIMFAVIVALGAVFLSLDLGLGFDLDENSVAIFINLASSFCSGAMGVAIRYTCLKTEELKMSVIEITMMKMLMSSVLIFIPAVVLEMIIFKPNFWQAIIEQWQMFPLILLGVVFTLMYQSAVVGASSQTKAMNLGVIHQFLILPQLLLYTVLSLTKVVPETWGLHGFYGTPVQIVGTIVIIVGTLGYGTTKAVDLWISRKK